MRVMLDPGHGGRSCPDGQAPGGAVGASGTLEKVYTLDLARRVRDILACSGVEAALTRDADVCVPLSDRVRAAEAMGVPLLSIHLNAASSPQAHGTEAFWWSGSGAPQASRRLAETVAQTVAARLGTTLRGVFDRNLAVLRAQVPAALVEVGFISNPEEERALVGSASARQRTAQAIAEGIGEYLGVEVRPCLPRWPLLVGAGLLLASAAPSVRQRLGRIL